MISRLSPPIALLALLTLAAPAHGQWCVDPEPVLRIGSSSGPGHDLYNVVGAHLSAEGTLVVADAGSSQLRFFDANGRLTNSVGRSGDGPAEFRKLLLMRAFSGDSLFTFDPEQQRASIFGPSGELKRSFRMPDSDGFPLVAAVSPDGHSVVKINRVYSSGETGTGVYGPEVELLSLGPGGDVEARLGTFPGDESFVLAAGESMIAGPLVFGRRLLVASAGDRVAVGLTNETDLRLLDGGAATLIPVGLDRLRARSSDFELVMNRELEVFPDEVRSIEARRYEDMPRADLLPAFADLQADATGLLWVRRQLRPDDPRRLWTVIDPAGDLRAEATTPDGANLLEIGRNHLIALSTNELGVETVALHTLHRGGCEGPGGP